MEFTCRAINTENAVDESNLSYSSLTLVGKYIILYGGTNKEMRRVNGMYVLDIDTFTWSKITSRGKPLPTRTMHSSVLVNDQLLILGGLDTMDYRNNLFRFDLLFQTMDEVPMRGHGPTIVAGHSSEFFPKRDCMMVFAGMRAHPTGGVFAYSLSAETWVQVETKGAAPSKRFKQGSVVVGSKWLLYGGQSLTEIDISKELFVLDTSRFVCTWSKVKVQDSLSVRSPVVRVRDLLFAFVGVDRTRPFIMDPSVMRAEEFVDLEDRSDRYTINLPIPRTTASFMAISNQDKIYVFGGKSSFGKGIETLVIEPSQTS